MKTVLFLVKFFDNPDYADDFVRGRIFANRLSKFKQAENGDESGRMDRHEGTTDWLQPGNIRLTINGMDLSDDLAGPLEIQAGWLNDLNVFCLHAAHTGDLDLASLSNDNIEILRQKLTIPDGCLLLGKYAVVVRNVPEFIDRMESAARAKGYRIAKGLVKYYDPATVHRSFRHVESVFQKQEQYSYQREFRFVIDRGLWEEPHLIMDIGDLRDITLQLESTELNGERFLGTARAGREGVEGAASGMNLGLKITWSSAKPSLAYLRLVGALRFHSLPLILPVLPPVQGSPKAARWAVLN